MGIVEEAVKTTVSFLADVNPFLIYLLVTTLAYLECAAFLGVFVPGETFVVLAGILASKGLLDIRLLVVLIGVAAYLGDVTGYYLGKKYGLSLFEHAKRLKLVLPDYLDQAGFFFKQYGSKTMIIARFIGFLRAAAPFLAGSTSVPLREFLIYDLIGALSWAAFFSLGGYYLGESFSLFEKYIGRMGTVALLVVAALIFGRRLIAHAVKGLETARKRYVAEIWLGLSILTGLGLLVYLGREAREADVFLEMQFLKWLVAVRSDWLTLIFTFLTSLGSGYFIVLFTMAAVFVFLLRRRYFDALLFSLAVALSSVFGSLLKLILRTERPDVPLISVPQETLSFPSGHVVSSSIIFWVTGWIVFREARGLLKYLSILLFLFPLGVGFSRLYFGYHWPVDVAGGYALAFVVFSVWVYFYEQGLKKGEKSEK